MAGATPKGNDHSSGTLMGIGPPLHRMACGSPPKCQEISLATLEINNNSLNNGTLKGPL